ncbi:Zn-ribbon domain-containing OB-fold protein [Haladaptatus sp. AB618]|nr:Zn-ribbon domain-containing OB-fold protein [Haladaptatus sp. AB618]MCO8256689.1 Zn-ribbon domain-containing OB-fold protein [Haladaptatus sp. AB618]
MTDEGNETRRNEDRTNGKRMNGESDRRTTVELPETIELPRLLDFYELQTDEHTRIHEFYDNLRAGVLSTTRCRNCGERHYPPRVVCPECTSDELEYVALPDEGKLYAFTAVRGGAPLGMGDDVPFTVGVVELDGVRLSARIDDADVDDLEIGDPVALKVVEIDDPADHERVFYRFEPKRRGADRP